VITINRSERLRNLSPAKRMLLLKSLQNEAVRTEAAKTIPVRPADEPAPLSFAQRRLFFVDQLFPQSPAYNMPAAVRLRGPLQVAVLEQSFNEQIRRHDILRTTFAFANGEPVQIISPAAPVFCRSATAPFFQLPIHLPMHQLPITSAPA